MSSLGLSDTEIRVLTAKLVAEVGAAIDRDFPGRTGDFYGDMERWFGHHWRHIIEVMVGVLSENNRRIQEDLRSAGVLGDR